MRDEIINISLDSEKRRVYIKYLDTYKLIVQDIAKLVFEDEDAYNNSGTSCARDIIALVLGISRKEANTLLCKEAVSIDLNSNSNRTVKNVLRAYGYIFKKVSSDNPYIVNCVDYLSDTYRSGAVIIADEHMFYLKNNIIYDKVFIREGFDISIDKQYIFDDIMSYNHFLLSAKIEDVGYLTAEYECC